jgi:hypothetical protein
MALPGIYSLSRCVSPTRRAEVWLLLRRQGGMKAVQVYERIREARVEFPESMSTELADLLRGTERASTARCRQ